MKIGIVIVLFHAFISVVEGDSEAVGIPGIQFVWGESARKDGAPRARNRKAKAPIAAGRSAICILLGEDNLLA